MKKRLLLTFAILLAVSVALAGCGVGETEEYTVLTGSETGVYYPLGGALARIISEEVDGINATPVASGASVANINDLAAGQAELALVQNDISYYANAGSHMFESAVTGFSAIATLYPEVVQIVTQADSGINSVEDLVGKRVAVGDQGSGAEANANQILDIHGITYDDIQVEYMSFTDASNNLQDGNIDAAFVTAGTPTAAIEQLKVSRDITIVSISPDKIAELHAEYPYYTSYSLSSDVYGTASDATTVAVQAMLIASNSLDEDTVYEITKAMFENLDVFQETHQRGHDITLDTAQDGISVDLHPGAQKYFNEQ